MAFNLKQRDLLKMLDFTTDEINYLIDLLCSKRHQLELVAVLKLQLEN